MSSAEQAPPLVVLLCSSPRYRRLGTYQKTFQGHVFCTREDGSGACIAAGFVSVTDEASAAWATREEA